MIELRQVSRVYRRGADDVVALDALSMEIPRGCFAAIMGPSGSGKSTLLHLVAGLDRPDRGEVQVAGQRLDPMNEDQLAGFRAAHIGIVFQFFNLIPVLNGLENVELPLRLTRLSKAERRERAVRALGIVGLAERARHAPSELSGGEQQRVAIARAIVTDPEIIVADEPTGDLDARNAESILELLGELRSQFQKTIVMVTHDARAERHADQIFRLDKGVLAGHETRAPGSAASAAAGEAR